MLISFIRNIVQYLYLQLEFNYVSSVEQEIYYPRCAVRTYIVPAGMIMHKCTQRVVGRETNIHYICLYIMCKD